jgi:membrane associated rhomboid family serine protease
MIPLRDDNPAHTSPLVTISFIVLCTLVYMYQASLPAEPGELFVYRFGAIPATVFGHAALPSEIHGAAPFMTLITSMFLHGSWMHLLGNMLYLWIFGDNIEDAMGHVRFVIFYVACGIIAVFSHAVTDPSSTVPMVGASGAISGVLGAYLLLFPRAQVLVLIPLGLYTRTMYVPAAFVLGLWFVMQVLSGGMSIGRSGGGVAFFAHVGGFLAGMALIGLFKRPDVPYFSPAKHRAWGKLE